MGRSRNRRWALAGLGVCVCLAAPASAAGATFEPTRKDDPEPGACKPNDCSLREALKAANASGSADKILLKGGTYELEIPAGSPPNETGGLDFVDSVTIAGRGQDKTTIDANGLDQVITVSNNGSTDKFGVRDLTLANGDADGGAQNDGGAILVGGTDHFKVLRTTMTQNTAPTSGGAISALTQSKLTVTRSILVANSATFGGGIEFRGRKLTVKNSTITQNQAGEGAGLDLRPGSVVPATRIASSSIWLNTASNKGGGMLVDGLPYSGPDPAENPDVEVTNSTFALNRANNDAGGIMGDNLAKIDIESSSIGFNRANFDNSGTAVGGGVYQHSSADFSIDDSVIAHNDDGAAGGDDDCSATEVFSGAGNALSSQTGCSVSFTEPFNVYSANPIAESLADNGGLTQTLKLAPASAAIGFANDCPKRDQRGRLRPANCDSGAYEDEPKRP